MTNPLPTAPIPTAPIRNCVGLIRDAVRDAIDRLWRPSADVVAASAAFALRGHGVEVVPDEILPLAKAMLAVSRAEHVLELVHRRTTEDDGIELDNPEFAAD